MSRKRISFLPPWVAFAAVAMMAVPAPAAVAAGDEYAAAAQRYDTYCVQCHGIDRNGRGLNSRDMSVQPRDHTDAKGMGGLPDEEMFNAIKKGGLAVNKSVLMPAWGSVMDDAEINELVAYLRHLCKCGKDQ